MFSQGISTPLSPSDIVKCIDLTENQIYYHPPNNDYVDPSRKVKMEEPFIRIHEKRSKIGQLLEQIDEENASLPEALTLMSSAEEGLEEAFQKSLRGADFSLLDLAEDLNLEVECVNKWVLLRINKHHEEILADCSPVTAKMLQFHNKFGPYSSIILKYCIESVAKWAGGSEKEAMAGWKYWLDEENSPFEDELQRLDTIISDLPTDLKLEEFMGGFLAYTIKTNGNVTEWSRKIMEDLMEEFNLSELEIVRWCHAYKIAHYTEKHGRLTPVNRKMVHVVTYFGVRWFEEMEKNLGFVCKWAGGSEEEVKASLEMFRRSEEAAESELREKILKRPSTSTSTY